MEDQALALMPMEPRSRLVSEEDTKRLLLLIMDMGQYLFKGTLV
jgi:hypothetical protein